MFWYSISSSENFIFVFPPNQMIIYVFLFTLYHLNTARLYFSLLFSPRIYQNKYQCAAHEELHSIFSPLILIGNHACRPNHTPTLRSLVDHQSTLFTAKYYSGCHLVRILHTAAHSSMLVIKNAH